MLDIGPIDITPRKLQIRVDGGTRVIRTPDDEATDDEETVAMQMLDGADGRVPDCTAVLAMGVLGARL